MCFLQYLKQAVLKKYLFFRADKGFGKPVPESNQQKLLSAVVQGYRERNVSLKLQMYIMMI